MISAMTGTIQPTIGWFRTVAAFFLVGLSLVLAYGGAHWSVASSLWDVPFDVGHYRRCDHGVIKNGELWFVSAKRSGNQFVDTTRIKRLDLQTGIEFETEIENVPGFRRKLLWIGSSLYVCAARTIYRTDGASIVTVATSVPEPLLANWFDCDGFLTNVSKTPEGEFRLIELIDGEWVFGRRMILPRGDVVWYDDPESGRKIFQLLPLLEPDTSLQLFVVTYQQQQHVLFTNSMISAYRAGFEFVDENVDSASAMAPENAPHDVTGWEPVNAAHFDSAFTAEPWRQFAHDRDGWLFKSDRYPNRIVRRDQDAHCEELVGEGEKMTWTTRMVDDSTTDTNYIIDEAPFWGGATIRRIEGNTIQPVHLVVNGFEHAYLRRWLLLAAGLACTWLTHLIVISGGIWLLRTGPSVCIQSGARQALLAPVWRRAGALAVDVMFFLSIVMSIHHIQFRGYYSGRLAGFVTELANLLYQVEWSLPDVITDKRMFEDLVQEANRLAPITPKLAVQLFVVSVALCIVKVFLEGRYGFTLGKWIFGIRTMRPLLRPCGFARALVRNVLYFVDFPFLLTPIPAAISMILSDKRQRLGDRVADTIVIRAGSVKEVRSPRPDSVNDSSNPNTAQLVPQS